MNDLITSPVFGVITSLIAYEIGIYIKNKGRLSIFNPLLIAIIILIFFLEKFHIPYADYNNGGQIISFFLFPATIALALPMYKKFALFKENAVSILIGIFSGAISGFICVVFLSKLFGLTNVLTESLIPKSITTPIGIALSKQLGGLSSITVVAIIMTGIIGSVVGPFLHKIFKIKDKVALGIAMGASAHALGTARSMEIGEIEGAMSGLTMAISGVVAVLLYPLLWKIVLEIFK
ncbi:LrgB family protein [Clostridium estertheticum]|uniref:LrgB family protein n=1 Tax=Clostridium estertheticum TaxID=238834 RepID=UPI001C7D468C|nr:LrgB family protein [Clostridium estertheticum]MBX4267328.1 LrgB family protein [Clostridium estertheticum]MBX4267656.1 LrgB family protein [Clostridium estertheticum]MCB2307112.1 LrgB family protein [Clostridium estertheticum]MCB2344040.1 LrgB family protein [Clostridium estertheticum]MCB2348346.1 LrgB family protein [Clostridium estertheticum]